MNKAPSPTKLAQEFTVFGIGYAAVVGTLLGLLALCSTHLETLL